jgi:AcrR family transcriptional regulator
MAGSGEFDALQRAALQRQVIDAAVEAFVRVGPDRFRIATIVDRFLDRGLPRSTLYRWIAEARASGRLGQAIGAQVKKAAQRRAARHTDPALDAATQMVKKLPAVTHPDEIGGVGGLTVVDHLQGCIHAANQVMAYARDGEGKPRAPRLLLHGAEHLRRSLDTAMRMLERIHDMQNVDEFHRQVIQEVRKESPACAERILVHLDHFSRQFTPAGDDHRAAV